MPSTMRLWKSLEYVQALQSPNDDHLPDYIFRAYRRMYDGYFSFRDQLPKDRLIEVKYESLVEDGVGVMQRIYEQLELGEFDSMQKPLTENLESRKDYKKNKHTLDAELVGQINEHWHDYFQHFDYPKQ